MAQRTCAGCGADISKLNGAVRRCAACCAEVMRAAGLEPLEPYPGTMKPWRSKCLRCGAETAPLLNNIRKGQGGCGWCSRRIVDPGTAAKVMLAAGLKPLIPYPGRHAPWHCLCLRCHQEVSPTYGAVKDGGGCRYCNDTAIAPDLAASAMRRVGLEPLEPYPGALQSWRCQCNKCGRVVRPCYSTIQRGDGGCRWCRDSGFKAGADAIVYLILHQEYCAAKIGVADTSGDRLKKHRSHGWDVIEVLHVNGERALAIENAILDWWRHDLGLSPWLGRADMPKGGWTETVSAAEISLAATVRRMRRLVQPE